MAETLCLDVVPSTSSSAPSTSTSAMGKWSKKRVTVSKDWEIRILTRQEEMVTLCNSYQMTVKKLVDMEPGPGDIIKRIMFSEELNIQQTAIRSLDRVIKEEIKRGMTALGSKNTLHQNFSGIARPSITTVAKTSIPVHPSTELKKEEFLEGLGLMSQEKFRIQKLKTGKVERRRRTANTNPKYSSNGFLKLDELSPRRSKRLETVPSDGSSGSCMLTSDSANLVPPHTQSCYICYGTDFDLSCESCTTKFHADCIKLTGSNAPTPHRLPICPKCVHCVHASNASERVRIQNRRYRRSIMQSTATARLSSDLLVKVDEEVEGVRIQNRRCKRAIIQSTARLPPGLVKIEEEVEEHNLLKLSMATPGRSPKVRRSNSTSEVEKCSNKNNHFRSFGSSKKQIEAVSPKSKMCNGGGGQTKSVRIARVRLNMRRSSEEPKSRNIAGASDSPTTTLTRSRQSPQSKQSEIRWQNKLKPKPLRTYGRKRLPITNISSEVPPHICVDTPCGLCILHGVTDTSNHEEDEENALLISHQSVGICPTIKTEKVNASDQQTPLVIKNNNDVNVSDQSYNSNHAAEDSHFKVLGTSRATPKKRARTPISMGVCDYDDYTSLPNSQILDSVTNTFNKGDILPGPKRKRRDRSSKAKAEHAIVIKKTIIAMSAAAATVMSNPLKCPLEGDDPYENDTIMQSISSVIAWSVAESELDDCDGGSNPLSNNSNSTMPMVMSPSMIKCEIHENEKSNSENENDEDCNQMLPPDNLSINGEADSVTSDDGKSNCSMKLSDDDEDDLLSVGNSPAPSWADGDAMSRSELVEKMLLVDEEIEQQELKTVIPCAIPMTESKIS